MNSQPLMASTRRNASDDGMIPLINIVFLLLIFFMIAGQISNSEPQPVVPPESSSQKPLIKPPLLLLMDSQQQLYLNGVAVDLAELELQLKAQQRQQALPPAVALKADKNVTAGQLDSVLQSLRNSGIATLTLYSQTPEAMR